jgi:hypothetical protein
MSHLIELEMPQEPTVVGVAGHNGWAIFVSVTTRNGETAIIDRRRVPLIEAELPNQPYEHETHGMDTTGAEELVRVVQQSSLHCAERELARLQSTKIGKIVAIALRDAPLPHLPTSVAAAHASYPVMVRADAMMYHEAVTKAAANMGIHIEAIKRGKEHQHAAEGLRIKLEYLDRWLTELRESLGPPWQKDHRDATARAIAGLSKFADLKLPT